MALAESQQVWLWQERLRRAEAKRKDWMDAADASLTHFLGEEKMDDGGREIINNKQYAATRTLHAGILPKRWRMRLRGLRPADDPAAKRSEALGNWNWHVVDFPNVADEVELTGQVQGVGISYTQWERGHTPVRSGEEVGIAKAGKQATEPDEAVGAALDSQEPRPIQNAKLVHIENIPPVDYLQDPKATCSERARWAAHALYMTEAEAKQLQKDGFFKKGLELNFARALESDPLDEDLDDAVNTDAVWEAGGTGETDEPEAHFRLWRYWMVHDFVEKKVLYVMFGTDQFLRPPKDNPFGNPYHTYRPNRTAERFWSYPDSFIYRPAHQAMNRVTDSKVLYANLLAAPRVFVPDDITPAEEDALASNIPGSVVKLKPKTLQQMQFSQLETGSQSINTLEADLARGITEMSAVSEIGSGVAQGLSSTTATAAQLSAGSQSLRSGYYRTQLIRWATQVAKRTVYLLQELFDAADAIPILGLSEAENWKVVDHEGPVTNAELQGSFDYELAVADDAEHMRAEERKLTLDALNIFAPFIGTGIVDPVELLQWGARRLDMPQELVKKDAGQQPPMAPQPGSAGTTSREAGAMRGPQNPTGLPAPDQNGRRGQQGLPGVTESSAQQPPRTR